MSSVDAFLGEIKMFCGTFAPDGWAFCNGQLLVIKEHQALFRLLENHYGGDGKTMFALPDLRGRVPMHAGQGPELANYNLGQREGVEDVTLTYLQLPVHKHRIEKSTENSGSSTADLKVFNGVADTNDPDKAQSVAGKISISALNKQPALSSEKSTGVIAKAITNIKAGGRDIPDTTKTAGHSMPVDNMQPYLAIHFIIALTGTFPIRTRPSYF